MQSTIKNRTIFNKDNLIILQGIDTESIDLIYLDPPFNKKKVFTAPIGSSAKGAEFSDIFKAEDIKDEWVQTIKEDHFSIYEILNAVKSIEGHTSYNYCYLVYMAIRLMECHRVLRDTGSIYLHCDPTMSHYLKIVLDCIFGEGNFRNELIWHYGKWSNAAKFFQRNHDIILFYSKNTDYIFNVQYQKFSEKTTIAKYARKVDKRGVAVQDKSKPMNVDEKKKKGVAMHDVWDMPIIHPMSSERTGYPTQKPIPLLERIIKTSTNENDIVLDPFCGCATTCVAAEKLKRQWIGIDISYRAYELVKERLKNEVEQKQEMPLFYEELVVFETDPPERTDKGKSQREQKWVYIITHANYPGEYKVGIASNITSRLNSYQTSDPERAFVLKYKLLTLYFREIEKHIHTTFDNKHEWVSGELEDIIMEIENYAPAQMETVGGQGLLFSTKK